ncbi:hypothetical protein BSKO_04566 [Bryopsis sp. KO-2023]|nr:hypothetical protein BSKO_04566 [Bryopsis sp. KO-2023]
MIAGLYWKYLSWMMYPEGTHLLIPWFERPIIYDVRAKPGLINSTSGSKDLQMETLKSVSAQYNGSQLLTMREMVSKDIRCILTERAKFVSTLKK